MNEKKIRKTNAEENKFAYLTVKLKISKYLEGLLTFLETVSKRKKDFIIKEALIQYLEHAEDMSQVFDREEKQGNKNFTTKELLKHLNLKELDA